MGFLLANWRFIVGIAVAIGFGWICATCQNRGATIDLLNGHIARLDTLLGAANDTIKARDRQVTRLKADTTRLIRSLTDQQKESLQLYARLSAGERAALLADQAIAAGKARVNLLVDKMTDLQKQQAANAGLAYENLSYVGSGLSAEDTATTTRIAKLTGYGKVYNDSTQALKKLAGQQREENRQLEGDKTALRDKNRELEDLLNTYRNADADAIEATLDQKRFLNWGLKKDARKVVNDIRAGRITQRIK